ncbi:MAG: hypothetical protein ACOVRJ_21450 [Roseateles sp.]
MTVAKRSICMLPGFVAGVWVQVRAALVIGLPSEDQSQASEASAAHEGPISARSSIRSMDDYSGYHTRNGLGSLDIGGGRSRWGE